MKTTEIRKRIESKILEMLVDVFEEGKTDYTFDHINVPELFPEKLLADVTLNGRLYSAYIFLGDKTLVNVQQETTPTNVIIDRANKELCNLDTDEGLAKAMKHIHADDNLIDSFIMLRECVGNADDLEIVKNSKLKNHIYGTYVGLPKSTPRLTSCDYNLRVLYR